MSLLKSIKEIIFFEKDEDFFNKEATIKEYFALCPPEKRKKVATYNELYEEALKYVNKQNFDENTKEQEDYFYEMDALDGSVAVLIGVFAYAIAYQTDKNGKKLEKKIDDILPKDFDKNNPFDTKIGNKHRDFGHDVFAFGLKNIPNNYPIFYKGRYCPIGEVVGKAGDISMLDLIWEFYGKGNGLLKGIFKCAGHTIVHFSKDLLTSEGLPLPFSSLFNKYIDLTDDEKIMGLGRSDVVDKDDYLLVNKFNRQVDEVKGNLKASDFTSLAFVEGMCKLYSHTKKLGEKEKSFNCDMKIIAMGTCIMIQMASLIIGKNNPANHKQKGKGAMIPGAKLNVIMTGAMFKNMVQEMGVVIKARHQVNVSYDIQLEEIKEKKNNE